MTTHERLYPDVQASFAQLVNGIASDAKDLAAAHAAQLQHEVSREVSNAGAAGARMAAGLALAGLGGIFLMVAIVMVLIELLLWPAWASWAVVGALTAGAGLALWALGRQRWAEVHFVPEQTLHSVRESLSCLTTTRI